MPTELELIDTLTAEEENLSLEDIWRSCDRQELSALIRKGQTLITLRELAKESNNQSEFNHWLKSKKLSKNKAYELIQLAYTAKELIESGKLAAENIDKFDQAAFKELAQAEPQIQELICAQAEEEEVIKKETIKSLNDDFVASNSEFLPDEVKENLATIGSGQAAKLHETLAMLPDEHLDEFKRSLAEEATPENVKTSTKQAKEMTTVLETIHQIACLEGTDSEAVLSEALRCDSLSPLAKVCKEALAVQLTILKLHQVWEKLEKSVDRLFVETGASTPQLRKLTEAIEYSLAGDTIKFDYTKPDQKPQISFKIEKQIHD